MPQKKENYLTNQEKIQVLLKEYDTLRAEMLQRFTQRFQFIMIIGVICGYAFFKEDSHQALIAKIALILVIIVWYWIGYLVATYSWRIAKIEKHVNKLAGEKLLQWETFQNKNGIFHVFYKWLKTDKYK